MNRMHEGNHPCWWNIPQTSLQTGHADRNSPAETVWYIEIIRRRHFEYPGNTAVRRLTLLEDISWVELSYTKLPPRGSDRKVFVGNLTKANRLIQGGTHLSVRDGAARMVDRVSSELHV